MASVSHTLSLTDRSLTPSLPLTGQVYRPVAQRGSAMYFLIRDLAALNNMYQTSLSAFLAIFRKSLGTQVCPGCDCGLNGPRYQSGIPTSPAALPYGATHQALCADTSDVLLHCCCIAHPT